MPLFIGVVGHNICVNHRFFMLYGQPIMYTYQFLQSGKKTFHRIISIGQLQFGVCVECPKYIPISLKTSHCRTQTTMGVKRMSVIASRTLIDITIKSEKYRRVL